MKARLEEVKQRIARAAEKAGRQPGEIKLIAVTKTVPVDLIEQAIHAGVTDIGENKVQEAVPKIAALKKKYPNVTWHMLGHLQRNKVALALEHFDLIQSVDSERLAREILKEAKGQKIPILVEVNTSGEASKYGIPVDSVLDFVKMLFTANLAVQGLMTIGPLSQSPEAARPCFRKLKELFDKIKQLNLAGPDFKYLSMGMSHDFEIAIEEGSTMIRVGQAIFGQRS